MPLLLPLISDVEESERVVEVDEFFEKNSLPKDTFIQRLVFKKSVFRKKPEVAEWLAGHFLSNDEIREEDGFFVAEQINAGQFIGAPIEVEIRRGVMAFVEILFMDSPGESFFTLGNGSDVQFKALEADARKVKTVIEVARTVDGNHARFGHIVITKETLLSFKKNFDDKVFGKDIVFDFDHEEREAAGWPKSLTLSEDGERLLAVVDWTPKGFDALSTREFRYFSPQFSLNFIKSTSGEEFGPTLTGGGITNKPFLDMEALVALNDKTKKEKSKMDTINLSEHNAAISKKDAEISELKLSSANLETEKKAIEGRKETVEAELSEMKEKVALSEKTGAFEALLSDGKACEAQREAYMSGDMIKFAESAAKLNVDGTGEDKTESDGDFSLSDKEKKMCVNMGITEDAYMKHNGLGKYRV